MISQPLTADILALLVEVPDLGSEIHPLNNFITIVLLHCTWWRHQMETFSASLSLCEGGCNCHRLIAVISDAELWRFLWPAPQQIFKQWMKTPVIWDAIALIMTSMQWFWSNWNWFLLFVLSHCQIYHRIRQQWLRWWLAANCPKPLPEPMAIWDYWHPY